MEFKFNSIEKDTEILSYTNEPRQFLVQLRDDFTVIIKKIADLNSEENSIFYKQKFIINNLSYDLEMKGEKEESLFKMESISYKDSNKNSVSELEDNIYNFDDNTEKILLFSKICKDLTDLIHISRIKKDEAISKRRGSVSICSMPIECFLNIEFQFTKTSQINKSEFIHNFNIEFGFDKDKGLFYYKNICTYDIQTYNYKDEEEIDLIPFTD